MRDPERGEQRALAARLDQEIADPVALSGLPDHLGAPPEFGDPDRLAAVAGVVRLQRIELVPPEAVGRVGRGPVVVRVGVDGNDVDERRRVAVGVGRVLELLEDLGGA